jgi:hypothetical protein
MSSDKSYQLDKKSEKAKHRLTNHYVGDNVRPCNMSRKHLSNIQTILDHGIGGLWIGLSAIFLGRITIVLLGTLVAGLGQDKMIGISLQFPLTSVLVRCTSRCSAHVRKQAKKTIRRH